MEDNREEPVAKGARIPRDKTRSTVTAHPSARAKSKSKAAKSGQPLFWKRFRRELLDHFFIAWTITACLFIASFNGWTHVGDSLLLAVIQKEMTLKPALSMGRTNPHVVVVKITPEDYENGNLFQSSSPLNRNTLLKGLGAILEKNPKGLAVDLDLSPTPTTPKKVQNDLDKLLDDALVNGTRVFLIKPYGLTASKQSHDLVEGWMRERCGHGVLFASSKIEQEYGSALRFRKTFPSLGVIVGVWNDKLSIGPEVGTAGTKSTEGQAAQSGLDSRLDMCAAIKHGADASSAEDFLSYLSHQENSNATFPIDMWSRYATFDFSKVDQLFDRPGSPDSAAAASPKTTTVFVGGAYNPGDRIFTGAGLADGVVVHAAISTSKTTNSEHWQAYLLELLTGIGLGFGFSSIWRGYDWAGQRYKEAVTHVPLRSARALGLASLRLFLCLLAVLMCLLAFGGIMSFSTRMLATGTWLNPAPLILGMLLDSLVNKTKTEETIVDEERHGTAIRSHVSVLRRSLLLHPGRLLMLLPILISCWLIMIGKE